MEAKPIASLDPGKIYVLRAYVRTKEETDRMRALLHEDFPELRFLIIPPGVELLGTAPEELMSVEEFIKPRTLPQPPPATQKCGQVICFK